MQTAFDNLPHIWNNPQFGCASNDWPQFHRLLLAIADSRGFLPHVLGTTGGEPIYLLERPTSRPAAKRLLLASGFHGEEPAGPWGLLHTLETLDDAVLDGIHLSVLPVVNITGFSRGTRFNHLGENPNRGFVSLDDGNLASEEGVILFAHGARLLEASRDGMITCHEDQTQSAAYIYANEHGDQPSAFALALRDCNASYFPLHTDGSVDGYTVQNGIAFNHIDSSFEYWLFKSGAANTYCTETPGQCAFEQRLQANAAMIKLFISNPP